MTQKQHETSVEDALEITPSGRAFLDFMKDVRAHLGELAPDDVFGHFQSAFYDEETPEEAVRSYLDGRCAS